MGLRACALIRQTVELDAHLSIRKLHAVPCVVLDGTMSGITRGFPQPGFVATPVL